MATNSRKPRVAFAAVLATTLVAAFAALGGVGVAESAISAVQYQYGHKKVTICHKGKKTIRVGEKAAIAHMRKHGDTLGACATEKAKKAKKAKKHDEAEKQDKRGHGDRKGDAKASDRDHRDDDHKSESEERKDRGKEGKSKGRGK